MKLLLSLIATTTAVLIATHLIPGASVDGIQTAIIVAVVLGVLNTFLKPLLKILTFPITVLTLGLFSIVINVFLILIVEYLVPGFEITTLLTAFIFSIALSLLNSFLMAIAK